MKTELTRRALAQLGFCTIAGTLFKLDETSPEDYSIVDDDKPIILTKKVTIPFGCSLCDYGKKADKLSITLDPTIIEFRDGLRLSSGGTVFGNVVHAYTSVTCICGRVYSISQEVKQALARG